MQIFEFLWEKKYFPPRMVKLVGVFSACLAMGWLVCQTGTAQAMPVAQADKSKVMGDFFKMPLVFEVNQGQTDSKVKYLSHGHAYNVFFTSSEIVFAFADTSITAQFVNADPQAEIAGVDKLQAKTNYLIGSDQTKWHRDIPNYGKVNYKNLYQGIDAVFYGKQDKFEYDVHVAPNADPAAFKLSFQGVENLKLDKNGDLVLKAAKGKILNMHKPVIYQEIDGVRHSVQGEFAMLADNQVGFKIGEYDKSKELVIDPTLYYSTYLGSKIVDGYVSEGHDVALDSTGMAYMVGNTTSPNFPTVNPYQSAVAGNNDVFVAKFDISKFGTSSLIYSTYVGGDKQDLGLAIAVDSSQQVWITGNTDKSQFVWFPTTSGAYQTAFTSKSTAFITVLHNLGNSLVYSTYFGPTGTGTTNAMTFGRGIAFDSSGYGYVVGDTTGGTNLTTDKFPTVNPIIYSGVMLDTNRGSKTAFITKFNISTGQPIYSTLFGQTKGTSKSNTWGYDIMPDSTGAAYIVGSTTTTGNTQDFPLLNPIIGQSKRYGNTMAFVAKLQPYSGSGNVLLDYSTYLGATAIDTSVTDGFSIDVDSSHAAYVTGRTNSLIFKTVNPYQAALQSTQAAFVTKLAPHTNGSFSAVTLAYSTYFGAATTDTSSTFGNGIAVDASSNAYVSGYTNSSNLPTLNAYQGSFGGGANDAFITKFKADGSGLVYSTYLGGTGDDRGVGIAVDSSGTMAYIVGYTGYPQTSPYFPTTANAYSTTLNAADAFLTVLWQHQLCWDQKIVNANTLSKQVDVFDIAVNKDTNCNAGDLSGRCVWANARHESDPTLSRAYLSANATAPAWLSGCGWDSGTTTTSAGRFGINKDSSVLSGVAAYLPTVTGSQSITHDGATPPTICTAYRYANTNITHDTVGFFRASSTLVYYSKWNAAASINDRVYISSDNGMNWARLPDLYTGISDLRINYMDGDDTAGKLFIATSRGLVECSNYPTCTNWSHLTSGANLNRVLYKYNALTGKSVLIYSSNTGSTDAGLYVSFDNGGHWSGKIVPPEATGVTYISGFDVDANNEVYITWYGTKASPSPLSSNFARMYTTENLVAGACNPHASGMNAAVDIQVGGLSIGKLGVDASSIPVINFGTGNFYYGTDNFYSNSVLGVTLLLGDNNRTKLVYVPSLGQSCNSGGYSIGSMCEEDNDIAVTKHNVKK